MNGPGFVPIDKPEIHSWADLAYLIADMFGEQRGLRIVKDDAILVVEPA